MEIMKASGSFFLATECAALVIQAFFETYPDIESYFGFG